MKSETKMTETEMTDSAKNLVFDEWRFSEYNKVVES